MSAVSECALPCPTAHEPYCLLGGPRQLVAASRDQFPLALQPVLREGIGEKIA